jgi:hypothetical protein
MKTLRSNMLAGTLATFLGIAATGEATAGGMYELQYEDEPDAAEMLADALIVRPMTLVASAVGAVGWVLSLPFTIPGGNVGEVGRKAVAEPLEYTFLRPVGYMEQGTRPRYQESAGDEATPRDSPYH